MLLISVFYPYICQIWEGGANRSRCLFFHTKPQYVMSRTAQVRFTITYSTHWGESISVRILSQGATRTVFLTTSDGEKWSGMTEISPEEEDEASSKGLRYSYQVVRGEDIVRSEPEGLRRFRIVCNRKLLLADSWTERILTAEWRSSAFIQCIFKSPVTTPDFGHCVLGFTALPPAEGRCWGVAGSSESLGAWKKPLIASRIGEYEWAVELSVEDFCKGFEYKYVLVNPESGLVELWEEGGNRVMDSQSVQYDEVVSRHDDLPRINLFPWKGGGVVVPVFSLRSKESAGIGDFGDLRKLVDWASGVGMKVVQTLPINDTNRGGSWRDSYPYNGISAFALHPIYVDVTEWNQTKAYKRHEMRFHELNSLIDVDYEATMSEKWAFLKDLFGEIGKEVTSSPKYEEFKEGNSYWLTDYSRFCTLRDEYLTADFRQWENEKGIKADEFHSFVQYLLHRQMSATHQYARLKGIILKGDIPIGICRDSADAWTEGQLFNFDEQAGAPPDAFDANGQNWGFPTYNWEKMERDGYMWWKNRLSHMGEYFDAYRIDHVLGFFRIWEIPSCQKYGILGHFRPAMPLSGKEIEEFGIHIDATLLSIPTIREGRYYRLIEEYGPVVIGFFDEGKEMNGQALRSLKAEWRSQRKLLAEVSLPEKLAAELSDIVAEVLFVPDPYLPGTFHPRFAAYSTELFKVLNKDEQTAFYNLHEYFFFKRHDDFWAKGAVRKLSVTNYNGEDGESCMLPCAEDLGMVPSSVKGVLSQLRILSLEIQRMPKQFGCRFADLSQYPYLSVASTGTHDMPTLRLWWQKLGTARQDFWRDVLGHDGEAPARAEGEVCKEIIRQHLASPSMLCILPIQDWLSIDSSLCRRPAEEEWINDPSNPDQYWRYRMDVTLEELTGNWNFNSMIGKEIKASGR